MSSYHWFGAGAVALALAGLFIKTDAPTKPHPAPLSHPIASTPAPVKTPPTSTTEKTATSHAKPSPKPPAKTAGPAKPPAVLTPAAPAVSAAQSPLPPSDTDFSGTPSLSLPLDCIGGETCFIQNYVDLDTTKGVRDYTCDKASYEGHKGTDFRLLSMRDVRRGVDVLADAPGVIKAVRDGVRDRLLRGPLPKELKGRECGNGLVIDHGHGWESQYCHMRRKSLRVKKGDRIMRGQKLGLVGVSGKTQFPHLHLAIRYKGKVIDPFTVRQPTMTGCARKQNREVNACTSLWQKQVLAQFPHSDATLFWHGFAIEKAHKALLMDRGAMIMPKDIKAPAIYYYASVINLRKGDQIKIDVQGPKGRLASTTTDPMNRHKASYLAFVGKQRYGFAWPRGSYKATLSLLRDGKALWTKHEEVKLK